jgi:predicted permease
LVISQIALSLVLLVAASLFVGTFRNLMYTDLGLSAEHLLVASTDMGRAQIPEERRTALRQDIQERLEAVPGVAAAAHAIRRPLSTWTWIGRAVPDGPYPEPDGDALTYLDRVTPGYFRAVGTPLLRGRDFDDRDNPTSPGVTVIDEHTARTLFGDDEAVGKVMRVNDNRYQVIGVVADAKYNSVTEPVRLRAYLCACQTTGLWGEVNYEIRSDIPVESLIPSVRAALAETAPNLAFEFRPLEQQLGDSLLRQRLVAILATLFGALALVMAMIGLYGVTSYAVAQRRGEIGVRMALGAQRGSVAWLVLRDVVVLLITGGIIGLAAALAAGRFIESLLYDVQPGDPAHLAIAVAVLAVAAAIAAWLPARRAARLDPVAALREE